MVYINSEGTVSDTRKRKWGLSIIRDFVVGVFDFVGIFFRTLTASPAALQTERVSIFSSVQALLYDNDSLSFSCVPYIFI